MPPIPKVLSFSYIFLCPRPHHHQILPTPCLPATSAHDFNFLVGCRPRLYVNLLADYRDDSGGHSHDGILGNEERGLARFLECSGIPDRGAGYLVLHAGIKDIPPKRVFIPKAGGGGRNAAYALVRVVLVAMMLSIRSVSPSMRCATLSMARIICDVCSCMPAFVAKVSAARSL